MINSNLSPAEVTRYARQMALGGWGREAQERLKSCRVLIAGMGELASSAALYLLASGVGALLLVDESRVALSDLSHQILFRERDLGKAKATGAQHRLKEINPFVIVESRVKTVSEHNVSRLASGCHLLLDAKNDLDTGYLLNRAAVKHRMPMVHAAVWGMDGHLTTLWPGQGPCLACVFPETSSAGQPALLGPLPGVLGTLQALEAIRILGGLGPALLGRLLIFKGEQFKFTEKPLKANPQCQVCRSLNP